MTRAFARPLGDLNKHYRLAVGMANRTGADLQLALEEGRITEADWANLVQRCRGCTWADRCEGWLAAHAPGTARTPAQCVNAATFDAALALQAETA